MRLEAGTRISDVNTIAVCLGGICLNRGFLALSGMQTQSTLLQSFCPAEISLITLHRRGRLNEVTHVKFFMASVLLALQATHKQCIVYRDLKLENLVIDNIGYIKLVDLWIS